MAKASKSSEVAEMTVAEKLKALYDLQLVDTSIDKIRILRGELPLEVQDLEDEIEGLQTRVTKYDDDIAALEVSGKWFQQRGNFTVRQFTRLQIVHFCSISTGIVAVGAVQKPQIGAVGVHLVEMDGIVVAHIVPA